MLLLLFLATTATSHPFSLEGFESDPSPSFPPYGIPLSPISPGKDVEIEDIIKKLSLDNSWPQEKELSFGKGKELEFEKELETLSKIAGFEKGLEKSSYGMSSSSAFPWAMYEKYFGLSKKLTFEQAMLFELYKQYGWYGLWVARELQRRFTIAKELGLVGREIAFQEAISLGLFKGIGLEKIFEAVNKAIGVEKATFEFDKGFGIFKKF